MAFEVIDPVAIFEYSSLFNCIYFTRGTKLYIYILYESLGNLLCLCCMWFPIKCIRIW